MGITKKKKVESSMKVELEGNREEGCRTESEFDL